MKHQRVYGADPVAKVVYVAEVTLNPAHAGARWLSLSAERDDAVAPGQQMVDDGGLLGASCARDEYVHGPQFGSRGGEDQRAER